MLYRMSTPSEETEKSDQSTEPPAGALGVPVDEKLRCGTLQYTKSGLFVLFGWLLWGDFCFTVFESAGGPGVLGLFLQDNFHVSNFQITLTLGLIPRIIAVVVGPALSFKSDRHRGRWGRRIPFMLFTMPFLCLFAVAVGCSDLIITYLKTSIGPTSFLSPMTTALIVIGFIVAGFTFFNEFVQNVYWYLFADVVPKAYMGRFIGLFRTVGSVAGWLLSYYIAPHQLTHMLWIHIGVAVLYFFGFGMMCLGVKEGTYPPATDVTETTTFWEKSRIYFTECMSHRIYIMMYLVTFFTAMSTIIGVAGVFGLHVDQHLKTVSAHSPGTTSLTMSADGKFAISGGTDHLLKLWNCADSKNFTLIKTLDGHGSPITCVAISADGSMAASGDEDGQIKIWKLPTGQCIKTLYNAGGLPAPLLAESPWTYRLNTFSADNGAVKCLAWFRDGNTLISGGDGSKVRIWDLPTGQVVQTLQGHSGAVNCIAVSSDEQQIATGSSDTTIRLWDARNWSPVRTLRESPGPVYALCFAPKLEPGPEQPKNNIPVVGFVVSYLQNIFSNESLMDYSNSKIVAENQWLFFGGRDGKDDNQNSLVRFLDVKDGKLVKALKGHKGAITSLSYKSDLHMIFSGSADKSVRLWTPEDISSIAGDQSLRAISGYTTAVTGVAAQPESYFMANASDLGELHLWNVDNGVSLKKHSRKLSFISIVAILLAFPTGMLVDRFNPLRITLLASLFIGPVQFSYFFFLHDYMSSVWIDCFKVPLFCLIGAAAMPLSMMIYPK
ncbi:MAG: hypothetical protein EHM48_03960, partial [Planctomycetaceae bacterium]